jgi:acyl-CoA thioester hydrolase
MKFHETYIRVRYGETDQMAVVYHGNYAAYLEEARTKWLRDMGVLYKKMEETGIALPVTSISFKFKKSALYDDVLRVKTILKKTPSVRLEFNYEIFNEQNVLLATADTELVFIDTERNRPTKAPNYFLEALENYKNE